MKVRYTGEAGIRKISKADFESKGVTDQEDISVAGPNLRTEHRQKFGLPQEVIDVSKDAATYLVENEDFEYIDTSNDADADDSSDDEEPETLTFTTLELGTRERLSEFAASHNIDLTGARTRAEMIETIKAAEPAT